MPLEQLVPMIKFWLVKNISDRPQVIRSKELKNGMLVMNPGAQEWVNCMVHQQVMECEWCETITNDVDYDETIGSGSVEVSPPGAGVYISLVEKDRTEGVSPDAARGHQRLPEIFNNIGVRAYDGETDTDAGNDNDALPTAAPSGRTRCAGIKADGAQCGRDADKGSAYCYIHEPKV